MNTSSNIVSSGDIKYSTAIGSTTLNLKGTSSDKPSISHFEYLIERFKKVKEDILSAEVTSETALNRVYGKVEGCENKKDNYREFSDGSWLGEFEGMVATLESFASRYNQQAVALSRLAG